MKKINALIIALFIGLGMAHAQDIYVAGSHNGTGKIWKNDTLIYSISDSISIELNAMQLSPDGRIMSAGCAFDTVAENVQGRVWMNDSLVFATGDSTIITSLALNGNDWTAGGWKQNEWETVMGLVWQNGQQLYAFNDSILQNQVDALAIDTATGDIYSAGCSSDSLSLCATVWKNDVMLWREDVSSAIIDLVYDGSNTYSIGYFLLEGIISPASWQNDSVVFSIDCMEDDAYFNALSVYNGSVYIAGWHNDSLVVWQDGEPLYGHVFTNGGDLTALAVDESGVYYAGVIDGIATVWKNGEVLYELANCESISDLAVMPSEPEPTYTLTVLADSTAWGNVTGGGDYHYGDTVTIEAIPAMGHTFLFWNDGIVTNPRDVIITQDTTFVAHFGLQQCVINTQVVPEGAGIVTGGGPTAYLYGDTITLEAIPNGGYAFEMWNDSVTTNPREIMVTQDSTFTAFFVERQYTITVESDHPAWGSVTGGGTFNYGDTIQIAATPNLGFAFAGWTDGIYTNPLTVIVTEDATYTAHFEIRQCTISTAVTPEGAGTVNGGGTFDYGETIRLTAHSNTGYVYSMWDDGVMANPRSVFVEGDATYTAVFTPLQYEITVTADPEEGGTVSGGGTYDYGSTAVLTATPNENYMFISWSDGIPTNPRNITVTGNATYKAIFYSSGTAQYTVTVMSNDTTLGTVTGGGTYPEGTTIDISATPNAGAYFTGWDDGNTDNPRSVTVTQNMTYTAIFNTVQTYTITVRPEYVLLGSTYGSGTYPANTVINIGATPNQGFHFAGWQDGNMDNPRQIIVTEDAEYVASFSENPVQTYTVTVYYDDTQGYILGAGTYTAGSTASVAAIAADGFVFKKWNDDTTDNPKEILVDRDIFLAAFFESTDVDESEYAHVRLYPNPANDKIQIEGLEGKHEILVYNAIGALVKATTLDANQEININELPAGLYLVRIDGQHAMRFVKR